MATNPISGGSTGSTGSPITFSGIGSGLDTKSIVTALMGAERRPVERLTSEEAKLHAQQSTLFNLQINLKQLSFMASEFALPAMYKQTQAVSSSEPLRVAASATSGAGIGGYQVEVKQLANAAQRTFTFASPAEEDTLTIDGQEFKVAAGATAKEVADKINASSTATVFAAALENGTIVLSSRKTGSSEGEFIKVEDPAGTLTEVAGKAKEGKNAEFKVDGVEGTSSTNTVTTAIAGVTLTLEGITSSGPVTINVQPPAPDPAKLEAKIEAFIKLYNSTVEEVGKQLSTKPPKGKNEEAIGVFFGDTELTDLLTQMRHSMYEAIGGLPAELSNPGAVGIGTGASSGSAPTKSAVEGLLTFEPEKLKEALAANPTGVAKMLQKWGVGLQNTIDASAGVGGSMELRINSESSEIQRLESRVTNMNELLEVREKALQTTYAKLETILAENSAKGSAVQREAEALASQLKH
jgi:flagellar hook-associated protein 2